MEERKITFKEKLKHLEANGYPLEKNGKVILHESYLKKTHDEYNELGFFSKEVTVEEAYKYLKDQEETVSHYYSDTPKKGEPWYKKYEGKILDEYGSRILDGEVVDKYFNYLNTLPEEEPEDLEDWWEAQTHTSAE